MRGIPTRHQVKALYEALAGITSSYFFKIQPFQIQL